jgi:hypothetical protein
MRLGIACAALALLIAPAYAADATGKWTATMPARGGGGGDRPGRIPDPARRGGTEGRNPGGRGGAPAESVFVLKVEGKKLTGTAQVPSFGPGPADPVEISDGKVDGSNISFTVSSPMGIDMYYKGFVSEDTIEFSRTSDFDDYGTPPVKFTAKRVK